MKLKVTPQCKPGLTVTTGLVAKEFLLEARTRFPNPSPFMEEFLCRFEDLVKKDKDTTHRIDQVQQHNEELHCPACGIDLLIETESV